MRLVYKTDDINAANKLCQLLNENGILANLQENGLGNGSSHIPQRNEIWIYVNSQYEDAMKLISNPDHKVSNPINHQEFIEFYKNNESVILKEMYSGIIKFGLVTFVVVAFIFLILFKIYA